MRNVLLLAFSLLIAHEIFAQGTDTTGVWKEKDLNEVTVVSKSTTRRMAGAVNGAVITQDELFKAACCNLGESFTTNPSVDVNYSDAATGAKQIKLLGLSGTYVQMLTENLPNFRVAAAPYSLGYVPGPWMKSIQVSKGSASVRNGYESITGQIDVEYLKPDDDEGVTFNLYGNTMSKLEANADANVHVKGPLATEILAHFENDWGHHDRNKDGFVDMPSVRQYNLQNRWRSVGDRYIFHAGISLLKEDREGGQAGHHVHTDNPYLINIATDRYEAYMKHAFVLNKEHGTNIALMSNASMHVQDGSYGYKGYYVNQKNAYAQLMFETNFTKEHNLSAGLSLNHDYLHQNIKDIDPRMYDNIGISDIYVYNPISHTTLIQKETTPGAYVQYTYNKDNRLILMGGVRIDHSDIYGTFVTPRVHVKYMPSDLVSFRLSAGKGYRTPFAYAENSNLLASGRILTVDNQLQQEEAWNYGISMAWLIPLFGNTLKLNTDYYYTDFKQQAVVDYEMSNYFISIHNLNGKSYSHTFQIDATYPLFKGMTVTAAYRLNDVKCAYGPDHKTMTKPLNSRYKGLLTASYKTPLGLWQFDATLQLNGGGRLPTPTLDGDGQAMWPERFHSYEQLSAQVTRWFRHLSIYIGGENLTGFRQKNPIVNAHDPWSNLFDATMVWGPVQGAMGYIGVRINFGKL
ncbi:MAG: TonB-dependent receptor [Prevotella sp.]|nr:TonB-dependent receptor [Prevotella sp.]